MYRLIQSCFTLMENDCRFLVVFYFQNIHDFCLLCLILNQSASHLQFFMSSVDLEVFSNVIAFISCGKLPRYKIKYIPSWLRKGSGDISSLVLVLCSALFKTTYQRMPILRGLICRSSARSYQIRKMNSRANINCDPV